MAFFGFECSACAHKDSTPSTVKVNMEDLAEQQQKEQEELQAVQAAEEERLAREKAVEEMAAAEAERQARDEADRLAKQEADCLAKLEAERVAEQERQAQAALEAAKAAKDQERKALVSAFLKKNGFKDVNSLKKSLLQFSSTYPLHKAAEAGDEKLVAMLLEEGAKPALKNSSGKTASQVAEKKNQKGSHAKVLELLPAAAAPKAKRGGA